MEDIYLTVPMIWSDLLRDMLLFLFYLSVVKFASKLLSWIENILPG